MTDTKIKRLLYHIIKIHKTFYNVTVTEPRAVGVYQGDSLSIKISMDTRRGHRVTAQKYPRAATEGAARETRDLKENRRNKSRSIQGKYRVERIQVTRV